MFKNILVSVSDKSGLVDFVFSITDKNSVIWSTGGTYKLLSGSPKLAGLKVREISELTQFPEVMGGRVKTLHPRVHMAILQRANRPEDQALLSDLGIQAFDALICNLYPFASAFNEGLSDEDLIEEIDIGGPAMVRAASKNFSSMTVITDPADYEWVGLDLQKIGGLSLDQRRTLAAKAFAHVSCYDSLVSQALSRGVWGANSARSEIAFGGQVVSELRYGENPHQKALWLSAQGAQTGLHHADFLQGKELSYNNVLDLDSARETVARLLTRFPGANTAIACVVKHNNPCGVALDQNPTIALKKALGADPISAFGGIVVCNFILGAQEAEVLNGIFLECVLAPRILPEARILLAQKKNLRLLEWPGVFTDSNRIEEMEIRSIGGGFLLQTKPRLLAGTENWKIHGPALPFSTSLDLQFAEVICAQLKSNAIAIVSGCQSLGLGMGQVNRVDAVDQAIQRAKQHHPQSLTSAVLASDAFFPFADSIEKIAESGIKWVIQPGGAIRDPEVLARAQQLGVNVVITGERFFKH